jgi:hypothetical protein
MQCETINEEKREIDMNNEICAQRSFFFVPSGLSNMNFLHREEKRDTPAWGNFY